MSRTLRLSVCAFNEGRGGAQTPVEHIVETIGLEEVEDYFSRARRTIGEARAGSFPKAGPAAW